MLGVLTWRTQELLLSDRADGVKDAKNVPSHQAVRIHNASDPL